MAGSDSKLFREYISQFTFTSSSPSHHSPHTLLRSICVKSQLQSPSAESHKPRNREIAGDEQDEEFNIPHFLAGPKSSNTSVNDPRSSRGLKMPKRTVSFPCSRPRKKRRGYAPPDTYAHLGRLPDHMKDELDVLFCGINPGCTSAKEGHHFAHPTNHFWPCLHLSGFTERRLHASEDGTLPGTYNLGLTNLVERPSSEQSELSREEMTVAAPRLLTRIATHRPRILCFVGKDIWLHVERMLLNLAPSPASLLSTPCSPMDNQRSKKRSSGKKTQSRQPASVFLWDIQPYKLTYNETVSGSVKETLFFVVPSTSARVARYQLKDKVKAFTALRNRLDQLKRMELDTSEMLPILAEAISI